MAEAKQDEKKPEDTIKKITLTPKVAYFVLKEEGNKKYETLLQRIIDKKCHVSHSSGHWTLDGKYCTQVHYFEVKEEKVRRPDTDFETTVSGFKETEEKPIGKEPEKPKEIVIRSDTIHFDGDMEKEPEKPIKKKTIIKRDKTPKSDSKK